MDLFVQTAHHISPLAASALIASVWEGFLLTAVVALALRMLRSVPPGMRTRIWTAVLILLMALPVLTMVVPHQQAAPQAELHVAEDWSVALLAIWTTLSTWRAVRLGLHAVRVWQVARSASPVPVHGAVAGLLKGSRRAELCVSSQVNRPSVAGFVRPRVLLPEGLLKSLSEAELEHVVLHEMEHLRRYDDWLNLFQQISLVLLPLNPALLWLDRQLCRERELACDDGVLQTTGAHRAYAACLVKLAEESLVRKGFVLALSALGTRARESELVGRVRRILTGPELTPKPVHMGLALGGLAVLMLGCAGLLTRSPQWVSFEPAPQVLAQTAMPGLSSPGIGTGDMQPATVKALSFRPKPVLAKAVMERSEPVLQHAAAVIVRHKRRVNRSARLRAATAEMPATSTGQAVVRISQRAMVPQPRLLVTSFAVAQPEFEVTWAAVPVRDGWLLIQL